MKELKQFLDEKFWKQIFSLDISKRESVLKAMVCNESIGKA